MRGRGLTLRRLGELLVISGAAALCVLLPGLAQGRSAAPLTQARYLSLAGQGIANTSAWSNSRYHWYNELLNDPKPYPQATVWGVVPLFEAVDYTALAHPSGANLAQVKRFAHRAESYWDTNVTPAPGIPVKSPAYAPYPGSYNDPETFFDDNAWWSLAFMDAHQAMVAARNSTLAARYLRDAERGFNFIEAHGWDQAGGGGMWWNTYHTIPGGQGRSGEALGAATDLAARLYQATNDPSYLQAAERYITWANAHLLKWDGSYAAAVPHEVTMPHDGEGAMIAGFTALCQSNAGPVPSGLYSMLGPNKTQGVNPSFRLPDDPGSWCSWAESLANHTAFGVNPGGGKMDGFLPLNEGPQWDAIYLRGLLSLYGYDHDAVWYRIASETAQRILTNAKGSDGLFLKTWSGSARVPDASAGEIRTHAASVSVLAALAAAPPPAG
jgi:Glycosyl hydrolase family 76